MTDDRIRSLDVLRGLAVVFMVTVHVLNVYGDNHGQGEVLREVIDFFGGPPAAPVFMTVMGFLFAGKKTAVLKTVIIRGIRLICAGYILNFLRGVVPFFIGRVLLELPPDHFSSRFNYEHLFFSVDIFIFAGLALIFMGLIRRYLRRPWMWEVAAVAIAFISPHLWGAAESVPFLGRVIQPLWGSSPDLVVFPLFPWLFFPLQGMVLRELYRRFPERIHLPMLLCGGAALLGGGAVLFSDYERFFNEYGQMKPAGLFAVGGFALLWALFAAFVDRVWPARLRSGFLVFLGRNVTSFYIIHWLLIGWLVLVIPSESVSTAMIVPATVLITAVSGLLVRQYLRLSSGCRA